MQIQDRTYYEDQVKMDAQWVIIFILVSSIGTLAIALTVMLNDEIKKWTEIAIVTATIVITDGIIIMLFRKLSLSITTTKLALNYKISPMGKHHVLAWTDIHAIRIHKMKSTSYGKQHKWKYGTTIIMNNKPGIEFELKSGKKLFLSMNDAEEFKRSIRKLELPVIIE